MAKELNLSQFPEVLKERASKLNNNLEIALKLCGKKIQSDIQNNMAHTLRDTTKSYYTNNKTKAHHPSLPGNPPAVDTGRLRDSINYEVVNNGNEVYGMVGTTQQDPDYGRWLEYGTTRGLVPRPWLYPAMRDNMEFIKKSISQAIKNTLMGVN